MSQCTFLMNPVISVLHWRFPNGQSVQGTPSRVSEFCVFHLLPNHLAPSNVLLQQCFPAVPIPIPGQSPGFSLTNSRVETNFLIKCPGWSQTRDRPRSVCTAHWRNQNKNSRFRFLPRARPKRQWCQMPRSHPGNRQIPDPRATIELKMPYSRNVSKSPYCPRGRAQLELTDA